MKKLLFVILFCWCSSYLKAQIETGFKLGLSYSNLTPVCVGVDCPFTRYIPGFIFGLSSNLQLGSRWTFQPELFYVSKGFEGRPGLPAAEIVNYIALPILLNYQLTPRLGIKSGPEYSYEFSHFLLRNSGISDVRDATARKFDFGISVGMCIQLSYNWYLDFRFTEGLTPFNLDNPRTKYRSFYLSFNRLLENNKKEK